MTEKETKEGVLGADYRRRENREGRREQKRKKSDAVKRRRKKTRECGWRLVKEGKREGRRRDNEN